MPETGSVTVTTSVAASPPDGIAGARATSCTASRTNAQLAAYVLPTVIATAEAASAAFRPGLVIVIPAGAATPAVTTYLLASPAKVTISPARTVPVPVISVIAVAPTA